MSLKLSALLELLNDFSYEREVLKDVICGVHFPLLLKIAQEQLVLPTEKEDDELGFSNEQYLAAQDDFSFDKYIGLYGFSEDEAEFLDSVLDRLCEKYPDKHRGVLGEELKEEFKVAKGRTDFGYEYRISEEKSRLARIQKYLDMFPDLKWEPGFEQQQLPFENIPEPIRLGGTPDEIEKHELDRRKVLAIKENILSKPEYELLRGPPPRVYYDKAYNDYTAQKKAFLIEFRAAVIAAGINFENEREYAEFNGEPEPIDLPIVKDLVSKKRKDLEERWHNLKREHGVLLSEIAALTPPDFAPKNSTEIKTFKQSVAAVTEYLGWIIKKFAIGRISFRPFASSSYSSNYHQNSVGLDISDLGKLLESTAPRSREALSPDYDYNAKSSAIAVEEAYNKQTRASLDAWRKFINHFDKMAPIRLQETLVKVDPESSKTIRWIEKYRQDIIRDIYEANIYDVAANTADEAYKFKDAERKILLDPDDGKRLDLNDRFFGYKLNQKKVMEKLLKDIMFQLRQVGNVVMDEILKKVRGTLFIKAKKNFEDKYFQYGVHIDPLTFEQSSYHGSAKTDMTLDKVLQFIQDYNGQPNLKSFMSVIQNVTKDPELAQNFVKMQLVSGTSYSNTGSREIANMLYTPSEFNSRIIDFVHKSKTSSVEDMIAGAEEELLPELEGLMEKSVAIALRYHLSNVDYKFGSSYYKQVKANSSGWAPIAPVFSGEEFKRWSGMKDDYGAREGYGINSALGKIKQQIRHTLIYKQQEFSMQPENYDKVNNILQKLNVDANYQMIVTAVEEMKQIYVDPPRKVFDATSSILQCPPTIGSECKFIKTAGFWRQIEAMSIPQDIDFDKTFIVKDLNRADNSCVIEVSGQDVLMPMKFVSSVNPSIDNYYDAMTSLIGSGKLSSTGNGYLTPESMVELLSYLGEFGVESSIQIINSKYGTYFYELVGEIFKRVNAARFNSSYLPELISAATSDLKKIDNISKFIISTDSVAPAFGGIGFRDINAGIDKVFGDAGITGVSKKEFVQKILGFVTYGLQDGAIDPVESVMIEGFVKSVANSIFRDAVAPIIKHLGVKDTKLIMIIATNTVSFRSNNNLDPKDLLKAIKTIPASNIEPLIAADRLLRSAAFIHNHSSIPTNYIKTLINSPNFYSDTKISKEFIETCTKLYLSEGIAAMKDSTTKSGKVIRQLIDSKLIADETIFFRTLTSFSRLCSNKDGVRPNLGNPTAEMKLDDFVATEFGADNLIAGWDKLDLNGKIASLRRKYEELFNVKSDLPQQEYSERVDDVMSNEVKKFDAAIKKIFQTASTPEQYAKDIKIKTTIQTAAAFMKLIEESTVMIKYAKDAKKKDARLLAINYDDPAGKFRFRTLKDLDPYHFTVGSDTDCCQRIGGIGENAAIDSFVNPMAGVLLLEANIDGEWKVVSQSYFHYVSKDNGVILDNVETNHANRISLMSKIPQNINDLYAAFARYLVNQGQIEYVRCGKSYNKLDNSKFTGASFRNDPRHFETSKYTDFKPSSHIDLLKPKFEPTIKFEQKKIKTSVKMAISNLAGMISKMSLKEEVRSLEALYAV